LLSSLLLWVSWVRVGFLLFHSRLWVFGYLIRGRGFFGYLIRGRGFKV
jgi:hypothetical protein